MKPIANLFIERVSHKSIGKWVDLGLGWQLMRSPQVSFRLKAVSVAIACTAVASLLAVEAPVELITAALIPVAGFLGDFSVDGIEIVLAPIVIAVALLPHLARKYQPELFQVKSPILIENH